jgi:CheY-like chemotaxis protein
LSDVRDQQRERRQHPRSRIAWPVLVEVGARRYACQAVDISAQGAKVSPQVPLRSGTAVRLQFVPPDGPLVRLGAVVWRVDADGLAFLFAHNLEHDRSGQQAGPTQEARNDVVRILVVDDDPHVRAVAADTLTLSGHEVDTAQDGVDALYLLKQHAYDIIVSDLRMPILDGPGLYRALQRHYAALLPRVIFVTGHADVEPYTTFLAQTGAPVLMKPFTRNELRLLIEWVLEP